VDPSKSGSDSIPDLDVQVFPLSYCCAVDSSDDLDSLYGELLRFLLETRSPHNRSRRIDRKFGRFGPERRRRASKMASFNASTNYLTADLVAPKNARSGAKNCAVLSRRVRRHKASRGINYIFDNTTNAY